jgi:hypothetical protein
VTKPKDRIVDRTKQVGGSHYNKFKIQPWDIIVEHELGYFTGNAIKYILRKKLDPVEDLKKAVHYLEQEIHLRSK